MVFPVSVLTFRAKVDKHDDEGELVNSLLKLGSQQKSAWLTNHSRPLEALLREQL